MSKSERELRLAPAVPGVGSGAEIRTAAGFGPPVKRSKLAELRREVPNFISKNKGLVSNRAFWDMLRRLGAARLSAPPRDAVAPMMFVATHHKVMTTYFNAVLPLLAFGLKARFQKVHVEAPDPASDLVLSMHGKLDLPALAPYRGIHIMRDPRDMIVSSYHYHKWTHETWVHRPDDAGETYQEKLNRVDKTAGLFMEIDHFIFFYRQTLADWSLEDPDILEVAYADLMGDQREEIYEAMFAHLGLEGSARSLGVDLMRLFEAGSRTGRKKGAVAAKSHVRSGKSGQWEQELEPTHVAYIEEELGPILRKFGY